MTTRPSAPAAGTAQGQFIAAANERRTAHIIQPKPTAQEYLSALKAGKPLDRFAPHTPRPALSPEEAKEQYDLLVKSKDHL
jgi:hypothetical protein